MEPGSFPSSSNVDRSTSKGEEKKEKREEKISKASRSRLTFGGSGRSNFERDEFSPFHPLLPRSCGVYGVIRRLFWDFVPFFESSLEFSFETWLNLWFWEGRGEKDWEGFFLDRV